MRRAMIAVLLMAPLSLTACSGGGGANERVHGWLRIPSDWSRDSESREVLPDFSEVSTPLSTDVASSQDGSTLNLSDAGTDHDLQNALQTLLRDTSNSALESQLNQALALIRPIAAEPADSNGNVNISQSQESSALGTINPLLIELNKINTKVCGNSGSGNSGSGGSTSTTTVSGE